jgi:plastocyanin
MRTRHPAALTVVLAMILSACSSGAGPGWTYAPTPPPTPAPSGAAPAAPSAAASAAPAGSGAPGASAAPSGSPAGSSAASGPASGTVLALTASGIAFDKTDLTAPAGAPFQITFTNNDAGIPHDVAIHTGSPTGPIVWQGAIITGVATQTYDVPALPAGTYGFTCVVHPNMTGTLTVK